MATKTRPADDNPEEERVYGMHAGLGLFQHRREDIRRVYVDEARLPDVKTLLRWCAKSGIAYHVVGPSDLEKVTRSTHHEGLCLLARKPAEPSLTDVVNELSTTPGAVRVLLLENVRDPHNVGAIVRTAAHFGVRAVVLVGESARRSSALLRTAEGGAEVVALVSAPSALDAAAAFAAAGFSLLATSSHGERSVYAEPLPQKVVVLLGAEREGLSKPLLARADRLVVIEGTGAVESLNVASATAVVLAELWRQTGAVAATHPVMTSATGGAARDTKAGQRPRDAKPRDRPRDTKAGQRPRQAKSRDRSREAKPTGSARPKPSPRR